MTPSPVVQARHAFQNAIEGLLRIDVARAADWEREWAGVARDIFPVLELGIKTNDVDWPAIAEALERWRGLCARNPITRAQHSWIGALIDRAKLAWQCNGLDQIDDASLSARGPDWRSVDTNDLALRTFLRAKGLLSGTVARVPLALLRMETPHQGFGATLQLDILDDLPRIRRGAVSRYLLPHPADRHVVDYGQDWLQAIEHAWTWSWHEIGRPPVDGVYRILDQGSPIGRIDGPSASGAFRHALVAGLSGAMPSSQILVIAKVIPDPTGASDGGFSLARVDGVYEKVRGFVIDPPCEISTIAVPAGDEHVVRAALASVRKDGSRIDRDMVEYIEVRRLAPDGAGFDGGGL